MTMISKNWKQLQEENDRLMAQPDINIKSIVIALGWLLVACGVGILIGKNI